MRSRFSLFIVLLALSGCLAAVEGPDADAAPGGCDGGEGGEGGGGCELAVRDSGLPPLGMDAGQTGEGAHGRGDAGDSGSAEGSPDAQVTGHASRGVCGEGNYVGQLSGMYMNPIIFELPVPVEGEAVDDPVTMVTRPALSFRLAPAQLPCQTEDGFCADYLVEGGRLYGQVNAAFPLEASFAGELDCATGAMRATIDSGTLRVFGLDLAVTGTLSGSYDTLEQTFFDGVWTLTEPETPSAGGSGAWHAARIND